MRRGSVHLPVQVGISGVAAVAPVLLPASPNLSLAGRRRPALRVAAP